MAELLLSKQKARVRFPLPAQMEYKVFFALSGLLIGYGLFAMIMNYRSALRGGGLLGGFGEIVLGIGFFWLIVISGVYLFHKMRNQK